MVLERGTTIDAWARGNVAGSAVTALGMAAAAAVVARDRPGNSIGWVFLAVAHLEALTVLGHGWLAGPPRGEQAIVVVVAWVAANAWWLGLMLLAFLPLLFPDGRLPSPR